MKVNLTWQQVAAITLLVGGVVTALVLLPEERLAVAVPLLSALIGGLASAVLPSVVSRRPEE